jgi:hypothetical protein
VIVLSAMLLRKLRDVIADAIRFRFPATSDALATLARVIEAERQRCRFLRFSITVEPAGGPIYFDLTGLREPESS